MKLTTRGHRRGGKPSRCHDCGHRRRRVGSATSKLGAEPRQHKKPCGCDCHHSERSTGSAPTGTTVPQAKEASPCA